MSLAVGTRLGPYEIVAPIGAGGMGEVYRARDSRLGRDVAIKVLPESLAGDPGRRERFEREARAVAALSHPNIINIFDTGLHDGHPFIVMEFLDGETLRARIAGGAMPIRKAVDIGVQIARGLGAAHDKQIVHRDLKPENIFILRNGEVKILDFGLAKALGPDSSSATASDTETRAAVTDAGVTMGTAGYMAPEQIRGQAVDGRTDLFAFGAVLFEMLSGVRAFRRDTTAETMTAILKEDVPDLASANAQIPPSLERIVRHCLEKNPAERFQSARDVAFALDTLAATTSNRLPSAFETSGAESSRRGGSRWMSRAAILVAMIVIAVAAWWFGRRARPADSAWSQFTQITDASGVETAPAISPDGSTVAYASDSAGSWDIYVQRVGGRNPVVVAGDPGIDEMWPAFSPDGKQIAFNHGGSKGGIFVVGATGESPRRLTDFGMNPAWSPDGQQIVFNSGEVLVGGNHPGPSALWILDLASGNVRKLDEGDGSQPSWSPSGRRIAFWQNVRGQRDLATISATGGPRVPLTNDAAVDLAPVWAPDGASVFFASDRGGAMAIWRIGVDEQSGRPTTEPELVVAGADRSIDLPHLTADGRTLVFRSMMESVNPASIAFDPATERAGEVRLLQHRTGKLMPSSVSPDGKWIALSNMFERQQDIFIMKPDGTSLERLTDDAAFDWMPKFTPDGTAVGFKSNKDGAYDAWSIRLDGSGRTRLTQGLGGDVGSPFFSPDGKKMVATVLPSQVVVGNLPGPFTGKTAHVMDAPKIGDSLFWPNQWSRDGRTWSGGLLAPSGVVRGNALYDIATGALRQLSDDAVGFDLIWLPGATRVVYFTANGRLVVQDLTSLKRHEIDVKLPFPPDSLATLAGAPDGRTFYYGARQLEANIWKVEQPAALKK